MVLLSGVLFCLISQFCKGFDENIYSTSTENRKTSTNYITINSNELSTIPLIEPLYYDSNYFKFYSSGEEIKIYDNYNYNYRTSFRFYPNIPNLHSIYIYDNREKINKDYCFLQGNENAKTNYIYLNVYDIINFSDENVGIEKTSNYVVFIRMSDDLKIYNYDYMYSNYHNNHYQYFKCKRLIKSRDNYNNEYYFGISDDSNYIYVFRGTSFDSELQFSSNDNIITIQKIYDYYFIIVTNSTIFIYYYYYENYELLRSIPIPKQYYNIRDCIITKNVIYFIVEGYGLIVLKYSISSDETKWNEETVSDYELLKFEGIYYIDSNPFTLGTIAKRNDEFELIDLLITHQNQMSPTIYDRIDIRNGYRNNANVTIWTDFINKRAYIYNDQLLVINRNIPRMKESFYIENQLNEIKKQIYEDMYYDDKKGYSSLVQIQMDNMTLLSSANGEQFISFVVKDSIRLVLSPISLKPNLKCNFIQDGLYLQKFTIYEDCSKENTNIYCNPNQENSDYRCQNDYYGYIYELIKCPIDVTYYINVISSNTTVQYDFDKLNKYKRAFWAILGLVIVVLVLIIILFVFILIKKKKKIDNISLHSLPNKSEPNIQENDLQKEVYQLKIDEPVAITTDFKEKP